MLTGVTDRSIATTQVDAHILAGLARGCSLLPYPHMSFPYMVAETHAGKRSNMSSLLPNMLEFMESAENLDSWTSRQKIRMHPTEQRW